MDFFQQKPENKGKHLIAKIELFHVRYPLPERFFPSWIPGFPQEQNRFDLIKITTTTGIIGYSAGASMSIERQGLGYLIAPYLIGEDACDIETLNQRLREVSYLGIRSAWIEPAFWDIIGKVENKPLCDLLTNDNNAHNKKVQVYCSLGQVYSPEEAMAIVQQRYDEGFRGVKLRVHDNDYDKDLQQVLAVCQKFATKMQIGVDANQGWRVTVISDCVKWDYQRAKRFADALHQAGASWLEEPLAMDDYELLSRLTAETKLDITGGELHTQGFPELNMMIERKCYNTFQPDATFTGGVTQALQIAQQCKKHGLKFTPHTWTNGIGFAINLHVFIATGSQKLLEYPFNPPGFTPEGRDAILVHPYYANNGFVETSDRPGLGFEIDEKKLKMYGERFFVMDNLRLKWFVLQDRGLKTALELDSKKRVRRGLPPNKRLPSFLLNFNVLNFVRTLKLVAFLICLALGKNFVSDNQITLQKCQPILLVSFAYVVFKLFYNRYLRCY